MKLKFVCLQRQNYRQRVLDAKFTSHSTSSVAPLTLYKSRSCSNQSAMSNTPTVYMLPITIATVQSNPC